MKLSKFRLIDNMNFGFLALGGMCHPVDFGTWWQLALGGNWHSVANAGSGECRIWQEPIGVRIFPSVLRSELTDRAA